MNAVWSAQLWPLMEPIYAEILEHPFLAGLSDGTLRSETFAYYLVQDGHYLRDYARALAVIGTKAPTETDMAMLARHSVGAATAEPALHAGLLPHLGVAADAGMAPTTRAYTSYLLATAYGGSFAEGLAAVLPCYWIYAQVREPQATTRELCRLAEAVHEGLAGTGVPLFINDRLDVALAVGAEGVHLGQSDLPPDAARRIADRALLIGVTVYNPDEVAMARAWPVGTVDYLGLAPVFASTTKPEAGPGLGLNGTVELWSAAGDLACVAIGGINSANADQVRATGVSGIAVVSAICAAADPCSAAAALR